jgi:hypothetical protein
VVKMILELLIWWKMWLKMDGIGGYNSRFLLKMNLFGKLNWYA